MIVPEYVLMVTGFAREIRLKNKKWRQKAPGIYLQEKQCIMEDIIDELMK